jgi:hypothetical protein
MAMFLRLQSLADSYRLEFGVKVKRRPARPQKEAPARRRDASHRKDACSRSHSRWHEKIANEYGGGLRISYSGGADISPQRIF